MTHRQHTTPNGLTINVGGRHRPMANLDDFPKLAKLVRRSKLPVAPALIDYFTKPKKALSAILGNDKLGLCTCCGVLHLTESFTACADAPVVFDTAQAILLYELATGYRPGYPNTDRGGNETDVLTFWKTKGVDGKGSHKILGFASIEPHDKELIRSALWLFGGLYLGLELADEWLNVTGDGFVWDVGQGEPNFSNGHCVVAVGANEHGLIIDSWGLLGTLTWAAVAKFCDRNAYGNLFAVLTSENVNRATKIAPSGLCLEQISEDFGLL